MPGIVYAFLRSRPQGGLVSCRQCGKATSQSYLKAANDRARLSETDILPDNNMKNGPSTDG